MSNIQIIPDNKIQLLKDQICKGATDGELQLFIATCNRTGLDPLAKQCWAVKRWDASLGREVMAFQTGVDGFRVIAERSEKYAGQLGPYWCGSDGEWKDVWLENTPPVAAKVGVLRTDFKEPLWAVAKFSSYAARKKDGSLTPFWSKMPELMIAKVAESLALRKAFPQDLSGIYSSEEMDQATEKDVSLSAEVGSPKCHPSPVAPNIDGGGAETNNAPKLSKPVPPPNFAPQSRAETYKIPFDFGTVKMGTTLVQLGKDETIKLRDAIIRYQNAQEAQKKPVSPRIIEFIEIANEYLK